MQGSPLINILEVARYRFKGYLKCPRQRSFFQRKLALASWLALGLIVLASSACLPSFAPPPTATATPSPTATPTPTETVIWFPPTATPTPFPTVEIAPTQDHRPDIGEVLFVEDFASGEHWELGRTSNGSLAIGIRELTIAIAEPRVYLSSVRAEPVLNDFYLEVTAGPSLCRGLDEYGVLFRVASPQDFYRFSLSCDGQVRVDRLVAGTASSPQPWILSGAVPPGAPSFSRLAIWARGRDMRFFVNDVYQFSISDPMLPSGAVGVFARSGNDRAVTVSFSDLVVREISK